MSKKIGSGTHRSGTSGQWTLYPLCSQLLRQIQDHRHTYIDPGCLALPGWQQMKKNCQRGLAQIGNRFIEGCVLPYYFFSEFESTVETLPPFPVWRSTGVRIWPDSEPVKLLSHPKQTPREGFSDRWTFAAKYLYWPIFKKRLHLGLVSL